MVKRRHKIQKSRSLIRAIILYLLILAFFSISAIVSWAAYFRQYVSSGQRSSGGYFVWYHFTDDDGTHYKGIYSRHSGTDKGEAEANARLGKQIEIFIDGQGNSILGSDRPNYIRYITIAIILTILAAGVIIFIIVKEVLLAKKKSFTKKMRG